MENSRYSGQNSRYANDEVEGYDSHKQHQGYTSYKQNQGHQDSGYNSSGYNSSGQESSGYSESDGGKTPRGYSRGQVAYERRHDVSGRLMAPRDASGRFLPVYPPGQRARSYYKARQSFQPVPPFKRDRHGRLHDALGRWMSDQAKPGQGPEGTPTQGARDNETPHKHGSEAARYSRRRSSSRSYEQAPASSGYGSQNSSSRSQSSRSQNSQQQQESRSSRSGRRSSYAPKEQGQQEFYVTIDGREHKIIGRIA